MATIPTERLPLGAAQQASTRAAFFIAGFAMGAWAPLVPFAKSRAHLDEGALGLLLLCLGAGSLVTMPITGMLTARFGCRAVICIASLLIAFTLPFLATLSTASSLAPLLFLFGAGVGTVDVAVNIQAIAVEKASGRTLMSGFHGLFSVGGLVGAAGLSGLLWLGLSPGAASLFISAAILLILAGFARNLLPSGDQEQAREPLLIVPRGKVKLIALLCFLLFLTEGAILDWSAVFLSSFRGVDPARAGVGYAAFSIAMTLGRLNGDRLVQSLGARQVLLAGGFGTVLGLALAVAVPSPVASILGFTLVGLGASNLVPVLFSTAGRQRDMPARTAISAITTIGYLGILAGPAFIGFVAHATSLPVAFALIAAAVLLVPLSVTKILAPDRAAL